MAILKNITGAAFADGVYAEGIEARLDLARFCAEEKIDCQLQMTGRFTGAMTPKDYDSLARNIDALNKIDGHEGWAVPRSEQHKEINTNRFWWCGACRNRRLSPGPVL